MPRLPAGIASIFMIFGDRSRPSGWTIKTANAETAVDPNWQPFINTPNFPEYPSGHASVSGAVSRMLTLFFGTDELNLQMTTTNRNAAQKTRFFTRFSQAEEEVIDARVYVGIRHRNSDRVVRMQGLRVGNWIFKSYLRPIGDSHWEQATHSRAVARFWARITGTSTCSRLNLRFRAAVLPRRI